MKIDPKQVIGDRYGKLVIIDARREGQNIICKCKCDCGYIKDNIRFGNMRSGHTKSCGNHYAEFVHRTHGMSHTRLERIYRKMRSRCYREKDEAYKYYGHKGIAVCDEWFTDPATFFDWAKQSGYADNLTLDRIDRNGNYEPQNCRWVTMKEQCSNRSTNRYLTFNGETKTITQWAETIGVKRSLISDRLERGWSIEDTLTKPVKKCSRVRYSGDELAKEIDGIKA